MNLEHAKRMLKHLEAQERRALWRPLSPEVIGWMEQGRHWAVFNGYFHMAQTLGKYITAGGYWYDATKGDIHASAQATAAEAHRGKAE